MYKRLQVPSLGSFGELLKVLSFLTKFQENSNSSISLSKVSFLTTLDKYKTYFKGRYTRRSYAESDLVSYSLGKKLLRLLHLRVL